MKTPEQIARYAFSGADSNSLTVAIAKRITQEAIEADRAQRSTRTVHIVFDGPPSHESGRFVEVETLDGKSIRLGRWIERPDGYWALEVEAVA